MRLIPFALVLVSLGAHAEPLTFAEAQKKLFTLYWSNRNQTTFYCGCPIRYQANKMVPALKSCGYQARKSPARAARIVWQHVMPAVDFGRQRLCWQEGGRNSCAKNDPGFAQIEGDMHNLVPVIAEIDRDRADMPFALWDGQSGQYGKCDLVVDFQARRVQPPARSRGAIARAYLSMAERYQLKLPLPQRQLFEACNSQNPVSAWECDRDDYIADIQGNHNRFIQQQCH